MELVGQGPAAKQDVEILLVEDDAKDLELTLRALRRNHISNQVEVARDGAEALDFIFARGGYSGRRIEQVPRLILLDLKLPKVDGLEVLRQVKAHPRTRRIPIVVLTPSRDERDLVESHDLGVNGYIVKPVDFQKLNEVVRQLGWHWLLLQTTGRDQLGGLWFAPAVQALKVLVVEDSPADAEMMVQELDRAGLRPEWTLAETREDFLAGIRAGPDLILCDYSLPDFDAHSALALLHESGLGIPLIVVTGSISDEVAVECLSRGASDYVLKDRLARLGSAALQALERKALADGKLRVEAELRGSEQLFRQLVEQLPAIVYLWEAGAEGECYYVSPAIESILGYPVREWLAESRLWASRVHPEDRERVIAEELRCRESGEDLLTKYRMFARDGRLVWVRDEAVMVRTEDGSPHHLQGLMYDISAEKRAQASLRRSREETIRRLSRAAEFRDDETGAHIERVSRYCELIGTHLGLHPERCEQLRIASPMHDVGKIGVADAILRKPGPLDPEERAEMERHAEIGYRILAGSGADLLDLAATIAWTHHEHYDGHGYPRGLKGDEIPLEGRIAAVADVFDGLTNDRVYRPAYSYAEATAMMRAERGSHFDLRLLDTFLAADLEIREIMGAVGQGDGPKTISEL